MRLFLTSGTITIKGARAPGIPPLPRKGTTGICYDFSSLFAAMCRSSSLVALVCALTKGYNLLPHVWNKVNPNGKWYQIDSTHAVTRRCSEERKTSPAMTAFHMTYTSTSDKVW